MNAKKLRKKGYEGTLSINKIIIGFFAFIMVLILSFISGSRFVAAHENSSEEPVMHKYYKSIQVEAGDTLWDLAEQYRNRENESVFDYIDEIKEINGLASDCIIESQYLTVAYYDTEFK